MPFDLSTSISDDVDDFDGLVPVTFVTRRTDTSGDADETFYRNINALPMEVGYRDMMMLELDNAGTTRVWHIKKSKLDDLGIEPRQGDEIHECTDDVTTKWSIASIGLQSLKTRYRFVCQQGQG